jgi:uncharacterized protein (DUF779 family)
MRYGRSPNKSFQRTGMDKVHGRGRGGFALEQVRHARVLMRLRAAAELSRWAAL